MPDESHSADLVFEGGGVKGIGLAGAYAELARRGFAPKSVAGTSAGAIFAALVAAGYSADELADIVATLPYESFKDETWEDRVPLVGRELNVLLHKGIYRGEAFLDWMRAHLEKKGITRFGQLTIPDAEDPEQRYRLRVIASDVTHRRMLVLPNDAHCLGLEAEDLEIAEAVRMSMSIPIFFEPVLHENKLAGTKHLIVDGGMLSNFPVWLFDRKGREPRWPTFGLMLVEPDPHAPLGSRLPRDEDAADPSSLLDYVKSLAHTMMEAHDRLYLDKATFARTIPIPTLGVGTTEFDITPTRAQALYESGRQAASHFLDQWDFEAYVQEFRRGKELPSRREELTAALRATGPAPPR
jgi:NTE family protein